MLLQQPFCHVTRDRFLPLPNIYFTDMQITGGYMYQLASWKFLFTATCSKMNRPEKFPFIATTN